ncbi:hypothetical protein [Aquitalea aquatica]|uniref:Uncharacterized protein n=1 Tax=Aquitalea aquatica TaxID=3044273 RepID=A0A838YAJ0_9NEIS|nr:hypothetical protein [Aquitalea magnusonii]MBA4709559.1 hypothetical protein [Aquitalea magnusonii]
MPDHEELQRALGRMEGKMDLMLARQNIHNDRIDKMDGRLREVEIRASKNGAISGAMAAIGTAIAAEMIKRGIL